MKVVKISNAKVRGLIEQFTAQYTKPDLIIFIKDGNGDFITSVENAQTLRYKTNRETFKKFINDNGIVTNLKNIKDVLAQYGEIIDYVKPTEVNE